MTWINLGMLGELFALCPYSTTGSAVEAVLDSSRYFVLKIEHEGLYTWVPQYTNDMN